MGEEILFDHAHGDDTPRIDPGRRSMITSRDATSFVAGPQIQTQPLFVSSAKAARIMKFMADTPEAVSIA